MRKIKTKSQGKVRICTGQVEGVEIPEDIGQRHPMLGAVEGEQYQVKDPTFIAELGALPGGGLRPCPNEAVMGMDDLRDFDVCLVHYELHELDIAGGRR